MPNRVLVAYATKHGATAEIADRIAAILREAGLTVEALPVDEVKSLAGYRAIILGSAVYIGRWRKEAVKFLAANEKALMKKAVWIFSSGPTGEGDPVELTQGWRMPAGMQAIVHRIGVRDVALFHGASDEKKLNAVERWMLKNVKAQAGDFRDWEAIGAWAAGIAAALKTAPAGPAGPAA